MTQKTRAGRNRTIDLNPDEQKLYCARLVKLSKPATVKDITNKTICQDVNKALEFLPDGFVDLLIIDPPYNLQKTYNASTFKKMDDQAYAAWVDGWLSNMVRLLKPEASIYVCCDWQSSLAICQVLGKYFYLRNRITWEREKGRGSKTNWKNCAEDIWYATNAKNYKFYPDRVMIKRKVIAPYKVDGAPKDWQETTGATFG